jgi:UDP-N-acetylglucosamine/UDP-N-acetylgalactosamine diphosphorylase
MSNWKSLSIDDIRAKLAGYGQDHLIAFWPSLSADERDALVADLAAIHFEQVSRLIPEYVTAKPELPMPTSIEPADFFPAAPNIDLVGKYADAVKAGVSLIRTNAVAALTVAGGQGTRLGFDGPKGAYRISPVKRKPLFQLFAENILGTEKRYGGSIVWYIMTSPVNDADTQAFFEESNYFGMAKENVRFFQQGVMPALSRDGKILLDQKHRVSLSPDGHGGTILALARSGMLADMADRGIEAISYFQVDNPAVRAIDPLFIGLHAMGRSEMSSKTIPKADDLERVGNFVMADGKLQVIEYSDLPEKLARAKNEAGGRKFDLGSIAIHVFSRSFIERLTADAAAFALPWHRADKKVAFVDPASGERIEPAEPNAVKLETFVFDALPLAKKPIVLQTRREEEFLPVKNATGVDSAETSRAGMIERFATWLESCGFDVPRKADGTPDGVYEISPTFALDAGHLREVLIARPTLTAGQEHYWG